MRARSRRISRGTLPQEVQSLEADAAADGSISREPAGPSVDFPQPDSPTTPTTRPGPSRTTLVHRVHSAAAAEQKPRTRLAEPLRQIVGFDRSLMPLAPGESGRRRRAVRPGHEGRRHVWPQTVWRAGSADESGSPRDNRRRSARRPDADFRLPAPDARAGCSRSAPAYRDGVEPRRSLDPVRARRGAGIHHHHPVAGLGDDAHVVGDQHQATFALPDQIAEEIG